MHITQRRLSFGQHTFISAADDPGRAPYAVAGRRMYVLGYGSGVVAPIGAEHIVGEMGGCWAHPVKFADGITITLLDPSGTALATADATFEECLHAVTWHWQAGPLSIQRTDAVAADAPVWLVRVVLTNPSAAPYNATVRAVAHLQFRGSWLSNLHPGALAYRIDGPRLLGSAAAQPGWGVALGAARTPSTWGLAPHEHGTQATLEYTITLPAAATTTIDLLLCAAHTGGSVAAAELHTHWLDQGDRLLSEQASLLAASFREGLRIQADNPDLPRDLALARANLHLLTADYPDLGEYFLAGLPEYPQFFGCDQTYSVPGAAAAGFPSVARSALLGLARVAERACGRIPHELTTNGRIFNPGNVQETPQFVLAVWDYLCWTGDVATVRRLYPICREGLQLVIPPISERHPPYPYGDGMVERPGMGAFKLDSACYAYAALQALAEIATVLGEPDAEAATRHAAALHEAFERDWWLESEGLYADSLHMDRRPQFDGHWTLMLPVQLGLAAPDRARRVLERIREGWINEWGLIHTRKHEPLVWTLPTGLLALALFAHGHADLGWRLTRNIALTAQYGALGTFKELIPEGLCFVQLWSAALYVQAVCEGLLGLGPRAFAHRASLAPSLPTGFGRINVSGVAIGEHRLNIQINGTHITVQHTVGPQPIIIEYVGAEYSIAVGASMILPQYSL